MPAQSMLSGGTDGLSLAEVGEGVLGIERGSVR